MNTSFKKFIAEYENITSKMPKIENLIEMQIKNGDINESELQKFMDKNSLNLIDSWLER